MIFYSEEQDEFGYLAETTFKTSQLASANFKRVKFPKGTKFDLKTTSTDMQMDRSVRQLVLADGFVDNFSGPAEIRVAKMVVERGQLADWLYSVLQNKVSEGGATGYLKQFKVHGSQPDFLSNAGFFFTLAYKPPVSAKGLLFTSCIVKSLELYFNRSGANDDNLVTIENMVILAQAHANGQTLSGTWVDPGTNYFNAYDFTFKYNDATAMVFKTLRLKIDNGARGELKTATGTPYTWILDWPHEGLAADLETWYTSETTGTPVDFLADYRAQTSRLYSLITSTASPNTGHLKIQFYGRITDTPQESQAKLMAAPAKFRIGHNSASTNDAVIIDLADGADQTP